MRKPNTEKQGKIIIPGGVCPWPHEIHAARILADMGHIVEFLPTNTIKTADISLDGTEFEIKSPITNNPKKLLRNIKRALYQSPNVILDSSRAKGINDDSIYKLLYSRAKEQKALKRLLLITKHGQVIDIK